MRPCSRRPAWSFPVVFALCLLPALALAVDCTPIATFVNDGTVEYETIGDNAVPGEPLCGYDYTGWDFHVYEFSIAAPTLEVFHLATSDGNPFSGTWPQGHLLVFEHCDFGQCLGQWATGGGAVSETLCLDAGTYTVLVASPDAGGSNIFSVGTGAIEPCAAVGSERAGWGVLKARY